MQNNGKCEPDRTEQTRRAIAEYLSRLDCGEQVHELEFLSKYPEIADDLAQFFDDVQALTDWLTRHNLHADDGT